MCRNPDSRNVTVVTAVVISGSPENKKGLGECPKPLILLSGDKGDRTPDLMTASQEEMKSFSFSSDCV